MHVLVYSEFDCYHDDRMNDYSVETSPYHLYSNRDDKKDDIDVVS